MSATIEAIYSACDNLDARTVLFIHEKNRLVWQGVWPDMPDRFDRRTVSQFFISTGTLDSVNAREVHFHI